MEKYDLIVIGSGVGLTVLNQGLNIGLKCALIEDAKMGGTCLTRGCIPSKVLVYPADVIRVAEHGKKIGIEYNTPKIDWDLISKRMWSQINESDQINQGLSQVPNLTIYKGVGEFCGKKQLKVKLNKNNTYSEIFQGEKIVIASGARSVIPSIPGINEVDPITSESFFGPKFPQKLWKSLIIIGGGIIASEFAHIFSAMGVKITIVEMLPNLVNTEEPEISEILENNFRSHFDVITNTKAIKFWKEESEKVAEIENIKTNEKKIIKADEIIIAVGRKSNADILKVQNAEIKTDINGWIQVNYFLETNVPNIWAIGDILGKFQFRHKANYDAEICINNIFTKNNKIAIDYSVVPWAIFTYPQIAHVGLTEKQAIDQGNEIYIAKKTYSSIAKGFAMGLEAKDGLFKLIVDINYKIIGAHAIGPHAATLIQQVVYLMNAGFTCAKEEIKIPQFLPRITSACPEAGSFMPIYKSMVIHPSLNEVIGWAIGNLKPVNISHHH